MWARAQGAAGAGCVPSVCTLSSRLPLATQAEPWRASAYSEKSEPQCVQCAQCGQGHWLHCMHCAHWEPNHMDAPSVIRRALATLGAIEGSVRCRRLLRPQHVNAPPGPTTRGRTRLQPGQGIGQRSGGRNCVRNRWTKTAIRSSGLARLLQTHRRAPPIRKSNRRGPHSPAKRPTD